MKTKIFFIGIILTFIVSCVSQKTPQGPISDPVYDGLTVGMTKQEVIAILGKNYKFDMNNVSQSATSYVETLIWNSKTNSNVAYTITFVNNKLSKKIQEKVIQTQGGGNIQINK